MSTFMSSTFIAGSSVHIRIYYLHTKQGSKTLPVFYLNGTAGTVVANRDYCGGRGNSRYAQIWTPPVQTFGVLEEWASSVHPSWRNRRFGSLNTIIILLPRFCFCGKCCCLQVCKCCCLQVCKYCCRQVWKCCCNSDMSKRFRNLLISYLCCTIRYCKGQFADAVCDIFPPLHLQEERWQAQYESEEVIPKISHSNMIGM